MTEIGKKRFEFTCEPDEDLRVFLDGAEALFKLFRLDDVVGRSEQLVHCTDDDHNARRFFGGEKQCGKCGHALR